MGKVKKDKVSKDSHDKKNKPDVGKKKKNGDKKKGSVGEGTRKYGYISPKSVITMAEAAGFSGLQDDVAKNLAEDVTYRLRYIIQQCKKYMIHSKHNKLSCSDINEVLKMCDVPAMYGYMVEQPVQNFIYVKEADVFVLEDNIIDLPSLALTEIKVQQKPPFFVAGHWLKAEDERQEGKSKAEDNNKSISSEMHSHSDIIKQGDKSSGLRESQKSSNENMGNETKIPTNLIKYYGITCNTILGHSELKMVFQDLSKNSRILSIIPYLLNFITIAINKLGSERQINRLLQAVEALSRNSAVDFSPYSATTRVINAMLLIVAVDKKPGKFHYSYHLRTYAARVLAMVLSQWCTRDEQKGAIIKKMTKLLTDYNTSAKVHYGAITLLVALGPDTFNNTFLEIMSQYLDYLAELKQNSTRAAAAATATDVSMLEEIILAAAAKIYRCRNIDIKSLTNLSISLCSYFGDSICSIWPSLSSNVKLLSVTYNRRVAEGEPELKYSKILKYMNSRYKPVVKKLMLENVFTLTQSRKRKNTRIMFKFAGAKPVPEVNLKRRRFDCKYSQFIAGKESEGHVVVAGKRSRLRLLQPHFQSNYLLPVGCIYSIL